MPFTRPTLQEIVDRIEADMESRLTGGAALLRHGVLRILARVFAGAVHGAYGFIDFISVQLFVTSAERKYLDRHGYMWGVVRKAASFAEHTCRFTGVNGSTIPASTKVQDDDGIEFETKVSGIIAGGFADIDIQAVEAGSAGNLTVGAILELISPVVGIDPTGTIQVAGLVAGESTETDDAYRLRILSKIQKPPMGGTVNDYIQWAEEVTGVDKAWCFAATPNAGDVTVVFRGSAAEATVENYIEERMPVTADLYVIRATAVILHTTIWIKPWSADLSSTVVAAVTNFIENVPEPGGELINTQLRNAISTTGLDDFEIKSLVKGATPYGVLDDVPLTNTQYFTASVSIGILS